jgi:hypothetical protein
MIHHHLTTALRVAVNYYLDADNQASTIAQLYAPAHDESALIQIIEELRNAPPKVIPHATAGAQKLPLIVAQQLSRAVIHRPLGGHSGGLEQSISRQTAMIEIMAAGVEVTETLSQMVVLALHALRSDFLRNGYLSFQFEDVAELAPQEQLAAEELGVFVRRVNISAMLHDTASRHSFSTDEIIGTLTLNLSPLGRVRPI